MRRLFFRGIMDTGVSADFGFSAVEGVGGVTLGVASVWVDFFFSTLGFTSDLISLSFSFFTVASPPAFFGRRCLGFARNDINSASYRSAVSSAALANARNMSSTLDGSVTPDALPPKSSHALHERDSLPREVPRERAFEPF